jgi:ABC-2 type transport system permease protein
MSIRKIFDKYMAFGVIGVKEVFLYPVNLLGRISVHLVRVGVYILIYKYLIEISQDGTLGGLSLIEASWSVALVQMIGQSSRHLYREISREIKTGAISVKLDKPYNYVLSLISKSFLEGILKLVVISIITAVFLTLLVGTPNMTPTLVLWLVIVSILGLLFNIFIEILIGLSSFWIENSDPIYWVVNRSAWLINGMMVPVALLPAWVKILSTYYPLSITFVVGRAFEQDLNHFLVAVVLLLWIGLIILITNLTFSKARRKLNIHGG